MISNKNIKLSNNTFIDELYPIYCALSNNKIFSDKHYESAGFKIWKYEDNYYILDKSMGVIVTWWKLLGWHVASNIPLRDDDWKRFCSCLKKDLQSNGLEVDNAIEV